MDVSFTGTFAIIVYCGLACRAGPVMFFNFAPSMLGTSPMLEGPGAL